MDRLRAAQYFDLSDESWYCYKCGNGFGSARGNYKEGRLIHERDPRGIHPPLIEGEYTFAPDPEWVRIVEFYCPGCGTQIETEYMPPRTPHHVRHRDRHAAAAHRRRRADHQGEPPCLQ